MVDLCDCQLQLAFESSVRKALAQSNVSNPFEEEERRDPTCFILSALGSELPSYKSRENYPVGV